MHFDQSSSISTSLNTCPQWQSLLTGCNANRGSWCTCSAPLSPTDLPELVWQSYLCCVYFVPDPGIASIMDFLLKKTSCWHLHQFSNVRSLAWLVPQVSYISMIKYVESVHTRFSGILGNLSYHLTECSSAQWNPARPSGQKLSETRETPWLFSSSPQTSFCNLTQRENCCPQEEHTVLSWYSLLLYLITFSSMEKLGQRIPAKCQCFAWVQAIFFHTKVLEEASLHNKLQVIFEQNHISTWHCSAFQIRVHLNYKKETQTFKISLWYLQSDILLDRVVATPKSWGGVDTLKQSTEKKLTYMVRKYNARCKESQDRKSVV